LRRGCLARLDYKSAAVRRSSFGRSSVVEPV
jgi:hypothetical protein